MPLAAMTTTIVLVVLIVLRLLERRLGWGEGDD
jgi:putative Mg2+ transporter-C (MgtC) family protein